MSLSIPLTVELTCASLLIDLTILLQVLCFDAYFQEAVHEKREEQYRIRR